MPETELVPVLESGRFIHTWVRHGGRLDLQKRTQPVPALSDLELQQLVFGYQLSHSAVLIFVDLAAVFLKVVAEDTLEEEASHGRPFAHDFGVEPAHIVEKRGSHAVADGADAGGVPGVNRAVGEDDFGVRVRSDQFRGKSARREIADSLQMEVISSTSCAKIFEAL